MPEEPILMGDNQNSRAGGLIIADQPKPFFNQQLVEAARDL
jgi:hypothetical protein